ncbi:porin [Pasteurellaceae bacterium LFhippo2]|nr:porin [Pasteurellaceae bacterium LFhippo2]
MKKTLLALTVAAVAATSAQAYTVVDYKETGTKVDFSGSARITWRSDSTKNTNVLTGQQNKSHINRAIANNGSRFGFRLTQQLGNDFYALGRVEWRLRGKDNRGVNARSQHNFDHVYTHQLYAGIGHKQYGELTYGNQTVITDEVKQTDLPNTLSLSDGLLDYAQRRSLQYVYKGIDGLKLGAYYAGSSPRGNDGLSLSAANQRKDAWGAAAIYNHKIDDVQSVKFGTGVTRNRTAANEATAFAFGTAYTFDKTTVGLDLERKETDARDNSQKGTRKEIRTVVYQNLTDRLRAYGMYAYKTNKVDNATGNDTKAKTNEFMVGTEYQLVSKADNPYVTAKTFVETKTSRTKNYTNNAKTSKSRDNAVVVGFRVYW